MSLLEVPILEYRKSTKPHRRTWWGRKGDKIQSFVFRHQDFEERVAKLIRQGWVETEPMRFNWL